MAWGSARALRIFATISLMAAGALPLACKKAGDGSGSSGVQFPIRVGGDGDATLIAKVGAIKSGDGQRLGFDLQREPLLGTAGLWACWDIPAPGTPLGRAVCASDAAKTFEVTATYADLLCRTNPDFGVVRATTDIDAEVCPGGYEILSYSFEPSGALEVLGRK